MTLLVAWAGVDTHGVGSMYIGADSRISWKKGVEFDHCRKIFAFSEYPDILGYCGDVLFPSIVLGQIIELGDSGLLFEENYSSVQKYQAIVNKLNHQFQAYPVIESGLAGNSLQIIHASKNPNSKSFECRSITWTKANGWRGTKVTLPQQSEILFTLGSGRQEFLENYQLFQSGDNTGTTRNIYHCLCHTILNSSDLQVGGAPQLAGLIRKPDSVAIEYGIIHQSQRYFLGSRIDDLRIRASNVEWRNENFERCDGLSMLRLEDAQAQPPSMG